MLLIGTLRSGDYDCARHSNLPLSMPGFLCNLPLSISGFCGKPGEVSLESSRVSGRCGRFKKYDIETDRGKSFKNFNLAKQLFTTKRYTFLELTKLLSHLSSYLAKKKGTCHATRK